MTANQMVYVLGRGGFARELAELLQTDCARGVEFAGFVGSDLDGDAIADVGCVGNDSWLESARPDARLALGAGLPKVRASILERHAYLSSSAWLSIVHPRASVSSSARIEGRSVFVGAGAVVSTAVSVADGGLVLWNATLGHDVRVDYCSCVFPGANVGGAVSIGRGCLIGSGAQILPGITIGDGAVIGAGAVVTRDVASGETVVGVPARVRGRR